MRIVIGETFSHYKILEEIGKGGMGRVYLAEDTLLRRRVAMKFPKPGNQAYQERFLVEARSASKLQHPNIAQIYDYGHTPEGQPFLVMELIDGRNLQQTLAETGPIAPGHVVEIAAGVLSALEEAHRQQIVHRDIKPSNVMITARGAVKVLDFGLAKHLSEQAAVAGHGLTGSPSETQTIGHTNPGVIIGTPRYMSPEQVRGATLDARTDLYSTGLLLYECLTGWPAFSASSNGEVMASIVTATPPQPSTLRAGISAELDRVTMKALEKQPAQRYQSAAEMRADLQAAGSGLSPQREPESGSFISLVRVFVAGHPMASIAAALVMLFAPFLGLFPLTHQPPPDAMRWYSEGLNALRDGTHYRASKALERSVALDGQFALAHARLAEAWSKLEYGGKAKDEMLRGLAASKPGWFASGESLLMDAISKTLTRDFKGAIESYQKIAQRAPEDQRAQAEVDLGRSYEDHERIPQALEHYKEAIRRAPEYATAFLRSGILYGKLHQLDSAEKSFQRADLLYRAASNLEGQTEVLFQRGYLASKSRKLDEAHSQFEQALNAARSTGNEFQQIAATLELSTVAQNAGNAGEAEEKAKEGIAWARRSGMALLENRGLVNLGNAYLGSFNYPAAEARFREAWEAARRASMPRLEARAAFSLGSVHLQESKPKQALAEAKASLAFYQPAGYLLETRLNELLMARAHRLLGELDAALAAFDSAFKLAEASKDVAMMETAKVGRAGVFADQESLPEAIAAYDQAIVLGTGLHDATRVFLSTVNRGKALWRLGRYEEAAKAFSDGEALARAPKGPQNRLWLVALNRAEMAESQGRAGEAVSLGREALRMAGSEPNRVASAKSVLGLALAHQGAFREGKTLAEEGLALTPQDDVGLQSAARLRLAEIHLAKGDIRAAQTGFTQVLAELAAHPQPLTVFRAAAQAAKAARKAGDSGQEQAFGRQAHTVLISLKATLGEPAFTTFSSRPDMREFIALAQKFN